MVDMEESASSCYGGACDERTRLSYRGGVRDESGRLLAGKWQHDCESYSHLKINDSSYIEGIRIRAGWTIDIPLPVLKTRTNPAPTPPPTFRSETKHLGLILGILRRRCASLGSNRTKVVLQHHSMHLNDTEAGESAPVRRAVTKAGKAGAPEKDGWESKSHIHSKGDERTRRAQTLGWDSKSDRANGTLWKSSLSFGRYRATMVSVSSVFPLWTRLQAAHISTPAHSYSHMPTFYDSSTLCISFTLHPLVHLLTWGLSHSLFSATSFTWCTVISWITTLLGIFDISPTSYSRLGSCISFSIYFCRC